MRCCRSGCCAYRDRLGANLIMLGVGTAIFGVFFFVNLFVQDVWGIPR